MLIGTKLLHLMMNTNTMNDSMLAGLVCSGYITQPMEGEPFCLVTHYYERYNRYAMPIWNDHNNIYLLGTNLILKRNTRCDNMAMAFALQ